MLYFGTPYEQATATICTLVYYHDDAKSTFLLSLAIHHFNINTHFTQPLRNNLALLNLVVIDLSHSQIQ